MENVYSVIINNLDKHIIVNDKALYFDFSLDVKSAEYNMLLWNKNNPNGNTDEIRLFKDDKIEILETTEENFSLYFFKAVELWKKEQDDLIPSLEELKTIKYAEVNAWTERKITGGFVSEATGEPIIYDSDVDTQITVSRMRANCGNQRFSEMFPDGMECRGRRSADAEKEVFFLQPNEIIRLDEDLGIHIRRSKIDGWTKQAQVKAAKTKEDLENIILN